MRKFLALALALTMVMGMATMAMADEVVLNPDLDSDPVTGNTSTGEVEVTVNGGTVATVYQVDVEWGNLEFTYDFGAGAVWNPETHTYNPAVDGWKNGNTSTIVLENHSNAPVKFSAKFGSNDSATKNGVTATLTNNIGSLDSADAEDYRNTAGPKATIDLALSGTPTVTTGEITVGTITVTISKP